MSTPFDDVVILEGSDQTIYAIPTDIVETFKLPPDRADAVRSACDSDVAGFDARTAVSYDSLGTIRLSTVGGASIPPVSFWLKQNDAYTPSVGSGEFWSQ